MDLDPKKFEVPKDDITITLRGETVTGGRRLDHFNEVTGVATEVKHYRSQNVSKSIDIEREVLMDKELLKQSTSIVKDVEWVFVGKGPSGPLKELLESPPEIKWKIHPLKTP